jgi:hypothetical protein
MLGEGQRARLAPPPLSPFENAGKFAGGEKKSFAIFAFLRAFAFLTNILQQRSF